MALDQEYFDSIKIEVAKKKYYNVNKVEAVLADIRRQAEELNAENERLRRELAAVGVQRSDLGGTVLSAQAIYRDIIEKAQNRADEILMEAERQRDEILAENERLQDYAVKKMEKCCDELRQQHLNAIDTINASFQDFLAGLYEEEPAATEKASAPVDLEEKVGAIARELFSLNEDDPDFEE